MSPKTIPQFYQEVVTKEIVSHLNIHKETEISGTKETWDGSHSVPKAQALLSSPLPLNFSSVGTGLLVRSAVSDSHVTQYALLATTSLLVCDSSLGPVDPFLLSPPSMDWFSPLSMFGLDSSRCLRLFSSSIYNKTFSTTISRSDHLLIFSHHVHSYLTFFLRIMSERVKNCGFYLCYKEEF